MKIIIVILTIAAVVIAIFASQQKLFSMTTTQPSPTSSVPPASSSTNFTAHFAIFTNGTFRIFTDPKYHNQSKEVFLTSDNPNKIHITKDGITWQQFFDTLPAPMKVTRDCLTTGTGQEFCGDLRFLINNEAAPDALDRIIQPNDKLLISFGLKDKVKELEKLEEISTL